MIKNILIFFYKIFFTNKLSILLYKHKFKIADYSYDFQNIIFINKFYLKNILYSKSYFLNKNYNENSFDYHTFDWLIMAKKIGGAECVALAKKQIFNWSNKKYSKRSFVWNNIFISKRLTNLIYNYDFFAISSPEVEKKYFHLIILEHFLALNYEFKIRKIEDQSISITKIILLMNLIYKKNVNHLIKILIRQINEMIDKNGCHKSNNPSYQAEFICQIHEIKKICLYFNIKVPHEIEYQIINMSSVLCNFFHKDNSIALFNGSNNFNYPELINTMNLVKDIKPKKLDNISNGITIYNDKIKKVFFDVAKPSSKQINQNLHAGTLSFEMSCNKEKIITNCGSIEKRIGRRPEYLRYSAAHSTIILNNTNISELVEKKSYKRIPKKIKFNFEENKGLLMWEASHDGYQNNFNKIVKRKITILKSVNKILGMDSIIPTKINHNKILYNIRFHLTPLCSCLATNNHKTVLIKTKSNQSWIFESSSPSTIEDSIFVGDGKKLEKTKQIVISNYTEVTKNIENWSFTKI